MILKYKEGMNKMELKHFIKTDDAHTAELLRDAGLYELAKEGDRWVFVNSVEKKIDFSSSNKSKMIFDNKLNF